MDFTMLVLTVVTQVPDAEERIVITEGRVDLARSKASMDTMDEYGVEEALRLREAGHEVEIVALAVGIDRAEETLRAALALGADRGVLVQVNTSLDVMAVSKIVSDVARQEAASLIFCGGQQADSDSQALGPAIAERLGWPQATWTNALTLQGRTLRGKHDVDAGIESFEVELPACVTTQQGLNEPRYPTLPNIMKSRKKEIRRQAAETFGTATKLKTTVSEVQFKKRMGIVIDGNSPDAAARLAQFLREEAKVTQ